MGAIVTTMAFLLLMVSLLFADSAIADTQHRNQIPLGSSLYSTTHPTSWPSPSGLFAFGFYPEGSGFVVGIWLVGKNNNHTVVWTANRDDPPLTSAATLQLTVEGKLVLQTQQGENKSIANTNATASSASMLDSGNFVLYNNRSSSVIWQSFDYPTDTILGDQSLFSGGQLFSSSSETSHSTGRFRLKMQADGNLVSYPRYTTDTDLDANWASDTNGIKYHLYLNKTGSLVIKNESDWRPIKSLFDASFSTSNIDNGNKTIYRATLDVDGVFRLYAHNSNDASNISGVGSWPSDVDACTLKGFCGFNSYCTSNDQSPYCKCLPGFDFIDPKQDTLGCKRNFSEAKCGGKKDDTPLYKMDHVENLVWGSNDRPYAQAEMTREECSSSCLEDCNCWAALYKDEVCMKQEPPLRFARRTLGNEGSLSSSSRAWLKVGDSKLNDSSHNDGRFGPRQPPQIKSTSKTAIVKIILVTSGFALLLCSTIGISSHLIYKIRVLRYKRLLEIGDLGVNEEVALRRFHTVSSKKQQMVSNMSWAMDVLEQFIKGFCTKVEVED